MSVTVAVIDSKTKILTGYLVKEKASGEDVVVPDDCGLSTNNQYKWDGKSFVPLGHGFKKPARPSVSMDYALFSFMSAVIYGNEKCVSLLCSQKNIDGTGTRCKKLKKGGLSGESIYFLV